MIIVPKSKAVYYSYDNYEFIFNAVSNICITYESLYNEDISKSQYFQDMFPSKPALITNNKKWNKIMNNMIILPQPHSFRIIDESFFGDKISHKVYLDKISKKWMSYDIGTNYEYYFRERTIANIANIKIKEQCVKKSPTNILADDAQIMLKNKWNKHYFPLLYKMFLCDFLILDIRIITFIKLLNMVV
jgi:hypothetical protein